MRGYNMNRSKILLIICIVVFILMSVAIVGQWKQINDLEYQNMVKQIQLNVCWMNIEKVVTTEIISSQ